MSSDERRGDASTNDTAWADGADERRGRTLAAGLLTACASFVALWPYTSVIAAGSWSLACLGVVIVVAVSGIFARLSRVSRVLRGLWPLLIQVLAAMCTLTLVVLPQGAFLGIIPTGTTISSLTSLAADAFLQVQSGTAPLDATLALSAMLGIGFAVVSILLDQLIAVRVTLLAVLLVAAVGALPMIVTLGEANIPWFVMLAVLAPFLLRHSIRHDRRTPRRTSPVVAVGIGAAAIVVALVVTPALPVSATWIGASGSVALNPSLRLGDDLRRPAPFDVITLATSEKAAPYLRIATLSRFDGRVWQPDEGDVQPLADGFGEADWSQDIATIDRRTSIRVNGISSSRLPVPYPATKIVGAATAWDVMPLNRTVVSESQEARGEDYTVTASTVEPTLEQIRAADAVLLAADARVNDELPPVIAATALEVTAGAENDYDRLIAMQDWFRAQFSYSLDAPVEGGFDGTGAEAVAAFLDARTGYCIHFAGAFALMAQSLDMPARIVVGYLPGRLSDEKRGDDFIYVVSSDQLHAWPEVRFEGIGWVPFEPTVSLGVPTEFQSEATAGGSVSGPTDTAPSAAPSAEATTAPELDRNQNDSSTADGELQRLDPTPVALVTLGLLLVVLLPALTRTALRMRRRARAHGGDAASAWRELQATMIDLGLPVSEADTPRVRGAELRERGADVAAVHVLVSAIEHASYARSAEQSGDLSRALARVSVNLRHSVDARTRVAALFLPRSLLAVDTLRAPARS
ncbi:transglutaminase [Microbacterium sp. CH12i]|uniref:transglutaminase family protein n=1 Tax=Microbacterium sp. CH12i TaxID=1479651 RepID=UPI000461AC44|nr:DUF3488 and transglutaminase-like domain-containing protein [Microbacterium sp. CH12i]KDA06119.1 transglutaminase [Microbacterium sp. CH12i]